MENRNFYQVEAVKEKARIKHYRKMLKKGYEKYPVFKAVGDGSLYNLRWYINECYNRYKKYTAIAEN